MELVGLRFGKKSPGRKFYAVSSHSRKFQATTNLMFQKSIGTIVISFESLNDWNEIGRCLMPEIQAKHSHTPSPTDAYK